MVCKTLCDLQITQECPLTSCGDPAEITVKYHTHAEGSHGKAHSLPAKGQTFLLKSGELTGSCSFFMLSPGGTQGNKDFPDRTDFKTQSNYCCEYLSEKTPSRPDISTRHVVSLELCPATWGPNFVLNDKQDYGWCSVTKSEINSYQTLDLICTVLKKTSGIMLTSFILIPHERNDLKYETAVHNYLRKAESEKCFWNNLLLYQQSNIIPDTIDDDVLLMKK